MINGKNGFDDAYVKWLAQYGTRTTYELHAWNRFGARLQVLEQRLEELSQR